LEITHLVEKLFISCMHDDPAFYFWTLLNLLIIDFLLSIYFFTGSSYVDF